MTELSGNTLIRPDWPAPANVHAFTTTRNGGFSEGPWASLNLGSSCGDDRRHVENNRRLLSGLLPSEPRWLRQIHGANVVGWDKANAPKTEADAVVSNHAGQVCAVLTADCLPVLFCNRHGTHIAAVHAGWRGLAAGVLEATVLAMQCEPADLLVWMGPAIGPRVFEVGKDVFDAFTTVNTGNSMAFKPHRDRWLADIYQLAAMALTRMDVSQVFGGSHCTFEEHDRFFSYRRDGETGRMASVVWLE